MNSVIKQFDIAGRSAIVTGGASGIGLAFAEAMAEAGAAVTIADVRKEAADEQADRLQSLGWRARAVQLDVSDGAAVDRVFKEHAELHDGLDIAFANAGIGSGPGYMSPSGDRDPEGQIDAVDPIHWQRTMGVNLNGAFYTIRAAAREMKAAGRRGSIVATTSNASAIVVPIVASAYMPAKAGVAHLVRTAALELAAFGIRVNAIAPGSFVTNIGGGVLHDPAVRAIWAKKVPLGDMGETSQIKPLALYLASDASSFVTGAEIVIDGGVTLDGH